MRAAWEIDDYWPPATWLSPMLRALTDIDASYLLATPSAPLLYDSGVVYRMDPTGRELWWDIPRVLRERAGDCKKLACWRAAELRIRYGVEAHALPVMQSLSGDVLVVHVVVQYPDGMTEDPSRRLGMR